MDHFSDSTSEFVSVESDDALGDQAAVRADDFNGLTGDKSAITLSHPNAEQRPT